MQGVTIVPSLFVERHIQEGRLKEIWRDTESSGEYIFLIWAEQQVQFKSLAEVVRWIHTEFDLEALV
jgi:DNA-binding transcriptional LysR family regulator